MATTSSAYAELLERAAGPDTTGYSSPYAEDIAALLNEAQGQRSYESPYAQQIADMTEALQSSKFTYDRDSDPNWQAARKQYLRDADRAASDVLAKASAATNGRASSYAVTAASQAADYYKSQLTDKQQALYDAAYQRYYQDYAQKLNLAQTLQAQDESRYNRWNDEYTNLLNRLGVLQGQEQSDYSRWYTERTNAYNNLVSLITATGYKPSEAELALAGMSPAEAAAWRSYYTNSQSSGSSGSGYRYRYTPKDTSDDRDLYDTSTLKNMTAATFNLYGKDTTKSAINEMRSEGKITNSQATVMHNYLDTLYKRAETQKKVAAKTTGGGTNTDRL